MKSTKLFIAVLKAILCMGGIFLIGYLGYHFPDSMMWMVATAVLCAFSYYFYSKDKDE
ncbi:MAG TPA: hypothetical protein VII28_10795 [Puia sp.]